MAYSIVVGGIEGKIGDLLDRIARVDALLDQVLDEDILPILARNYDASGLHTRSGTLRSAISKRGAHGNLISKSGGHLVVGIDTSAVPYARWALEGRGAATASPGHTFRFYDSSGKPIFAKHIKATPAHDIYYLTPADLAQVEAHLQQLLTQSA